MSKVFAQRCLRSFSVLFMTEILYICCGGIGLLLLFKMKKHFRVCLVDDKVLISLLKFCKFLLRRMKAFSDHNVIFVLCIQLTSPSV